MTLSSELAWWGPRADQSAMAAFGIRLGGGGAHQSKTMMFEELETLLAIGPTEPSDLREAIITNNVLGKPTVNTRSVTHRQLVALYGLGGRTPITKVLLALWKADPAGRRPLALLVALARDPLLRDSAIAVVDGAIGSPVQRPIFETELSTAHPGRWSDAMLRSLAQNCASTWTQSGHLEGPVRKIRRRVVPTPANVAFAALLAMVSGFGGPAILSSIWMKVLDLLPDQALDQLRRAEAVGLARVRSAGEIIEISVRRQMAATLGVAGLEQL